MPASRGGGDATVRVVAGEARGRRLESAERPGLRPTLDRVREALFSILGDVTGRTVLDLFAGTGALGVEALSRGARRAVFVDQDRTTLELVRTNLERTGFSARARVEALALPSGLRPLSRRETEAFDLVLMDPPYEGPVRDLTLHDPLLARLLSPTGVLVLEHDVRQPPAERAGELRCVDRRRYGSAGLSFYESARADREAS